MKFIEDQPLREFFKELQFDADTQFEAAIDKAIKQNGKIKYQKSITLTEKGEDKWQSLATLSLLEMDFDQLENHLKIDGNTN
jgi:hypothetical protein